MKMTEQEQKFSEDDRKKVVELVVATNAEITNEQFKKLMAAIGKEVGIKYSVRVEYRWEDEPPSDITDSKTFKMQDFNFVTHPKTGAKYLAFFRSSDGHIYYPRWCELLVFEDKKFIDIKSASLSRPGELLLSFDNPGEYVDRDSDLEGLVSDDIFQAIIEYSESALKSKKQESMKRLKHSRCLLKNIIQQERNG